MWDKGWRERIWSNLDQRWDIIVIGGGITGAGILKEASRAGLNTLMVEAQDFGSGTSSRSSKLVHGGFRYLRNLQLKMTLQSVRERERLLHEGRGLVTPLGFLLVNYHKDEIPPWVFSAGLAVYDLLALKWGHRRYDHIDMHDLCPPLSEPGLVGGFRYFDAQTDDARLVLRVIQEAVVGGAVAINYARVIDLLKDKNGRVCGVVVEDASQESNLGSLEIQASVVINASGAWADTLRKTIGGRKRLRLLRGSHLIFPSHRLQLTRSVSFLHPADQRPVFAFPWERVTLIGTTDVDLDGSIETDVSISEPEIDYLLHAAQYAFSCLELKREDIQCTFSGIRPVIDSGKTDPSKESREHILWLENGLLSVTGGKLTTFRLMALDTLRKIQPYLPFHVRLDPDARMLAEPPVELPGSDQLDPTARMRLLGRYGKAAPALVQAAELGEMVNIGPTASFWVELRWAARAEGVVHLDDLLLRRVRLGLQLPCGGLDHISRIRSIVQSELGWNDARWEMELARYRSILEKNYHLK